METLTIRLAGKDFTIQPLTVGQLEELHVGIVRANNSNPEENVRDFWKQNVGILAEALKVDHPEMTAEALRKLRLGSLKDVKQQVDAVLLFAGLIDSPEEMEAKVAAAAKAVNGQGAAPTGEASAGAA